MPGVPGESDRHIRRTSSSFSRSAGSVHPRRPLATDSVLRTRSRRYCLCVLFSADDLEMFREVARRGSLTSAAQQLGVDHTTVGRRLSKLEKAVGERLFIRRRSGWQLTDAGIRLLDHAETVHSAVSLANEEYLDAAKTLAGSVRAVAPEGFAAYLLVPGMGPLTTRYPELSVEVVTANRHTSLGTREYDIAVSIERPETRSVVVEKLADFELRVYAAPSYLSANAPIHSEKDLSDHPFIWYVEEALTSDTYHLLRDLIPLARPRIQTNSLPGQVSAARRGLGLALLPSWVADGDSGLVQVDHVDLAAHRSYWMLTPTNLSRLARVKVVAQLIRGLVNEQTGLARSRG